MADLHVLPQLTVLELQQELKKRGLKKTGNKPKLIQRLKEHIEKHGPEAKPAPLPTVRKPIPKRIIKQINDPHPYLADYEEQLISDNNVEVDDHLNPMLANVTEDQTTESLVVENQETENEVSEDQKEEHVTELSEESVNARDMAEELTEPIHNQETNFNDRIIQLEDASPNEVELAFEEERQEETMEEVQNEERQKEAVEEGRLTEAMEDIRQEETMEDVRQEETMEGLRQEEAEETEQGKDSDIAEEEEATEAAVADVLHAAEDEVVVNAEEIDQLPAPSEQYATERSQQSEDEGEICDGSVEIRRESRDTNKAAEEDTSKPKLKPVTPVLLRKRVSLQASSETTEEKAVKRKRRWGSTSIKESSVAISGESIKKLIPEVKIDASILEGVPELDYQEDDVIEDVAESKPPPMEEVEMVKESPVTNRSGRTVKVDSAKRITFGKRQTAAETVVIESDSGEIIPPVKTHSIRPLDFDDDTEHQEKREKSPSPAKNNVSCYIHIENLVRPYTVNQLKGLVRRTGTICEERGFWINNIKSHCYVKLSSEEGATATREALHGVKWPSGNPKFLRVDYALMEHMWNETEGAIGEKPKIVIEIPDKETEADSRRKRRHSENEHKEQRDRNERKKKEKTKDKENREDREESPAKLLDDLFRKTKATPCIYWLPFTEEQILKREKKEAEQKNNRSRDFDNEQVRDNRRFNNRSPDRRFQQNRNQQRRWR